MGKNADLGPTPKRVNADQFRIHFWGALTRILITPIFEGP